MSIWTVYIWLDVSDKGGWQIIEHDLPIDMAVNIQQEYEYIHGIPACVYIKYMVPE